MLAGGIIEGGAAIIIAGLGCAAIFGQIKTNAERNTRDIEAIKIMIKEYQEATQNLIANNMKDMKNLIDENKFHQKESLEREISHIKDLLNVSSMETREDIKRLEAAQRESNKIKERIALAEASLRSLHKRLDIESPTILRERDD